MGPSRIITGNSRISYLPLLIDFSRTIVRNKHKRSNVQSSSSFKQFRPAYSYITCAVWLTHVKNNSEVTVVSPLRSVSTTRVHGPSSRPELTARALGCTSVYTARVHGRPVSTTRVDGPSWRVSKNAPVNSARELGPWTWVVETDLK